MKFILKLVVTALLLFFLTRMTDPAQLQNLLGHIDPIWILAAIGLIAVNTVVDALLFTNIMASQGHRIQLKASIAYSLVGWFFGNLAPSSVGADFFRAAQMRRLGVPTVAALRVVLSYRLMSFVALTALIVIGIPFGFPLVSSNTDKAVLIITATVGVTVIVGAFIIGLSTSAQRFAGRFGFVRPFVTVARDVTNISFLSEGSFSSWIYATIQHLIRLFIIAALAKSLSLDVQFIVLFAFVPVSLLIAMIPISLGSWGVREASFVYFLGLTGVSLEGALYLSIAFGLVRVFAGVVGGVFWVFAQKDVYRVELMDTQAR